MAIQCLFTIVAMNCKLYIYKGIEYNVSILLFLFFWQLYLVTFLIGILISLANRSMVHFEFTNDLVLNE